MYGPGFSCVGLIFLLMLFVPKILWAKRRPAAFFLLGVYGRNALMLVAVAMLGVLSTSLDLGVPAWHAAIRAALPEQHHAANITAFDAGRAYARG